MMESEKKIKMLQMFYAAALADSVLRLGNENVLKKVTEQKKEEQLKSGAVRASQLGISKPKEVFEILPEVFGCANWKTEATESGFEAKTSACMLCSLSKRLGAESPCNIYCLDAMEGMVKGLDKNAEFEVISTLWNDSACRVNVKTESK